MFRSLTIALITLACMALGTAASADPPDTAPMHDTCESEAAVICDGVPVDNDCDGVDSVRHGYVCAESDTLAPAQMANPCNDCDGPADVPRPTLLPAPTATRRTDHDLTCDDGDAVSVLALTVHLPVLPHRDLQRRTAQG
jgi:hypothetical protein